MADQAPPRRVWAHETQAQIPLKDGRVKTFNARYSGQTMIGPDGKRYKPGMKSQGYWEAQLQKAQRKLANPNSWRPPAIHPSQNQAFVTREPIREPKIPTQYRRPPVTGSKKDKRGRPRRVHVPAHELYNDAHREDQVLQAQIYMEEQQRILAQQQQAFY